MSRIWGAVIGVKGGHFDERKVYEVFGFVLFYGISTIVGYLKLNPVYTYISK